VAEVPLGAVLAVAVVEAGDIRKLKYVIGNNGFENTFGKISIFKIYN
jgi:hypothetical protein